jgi:hypothetical protein
VLVWLDLVEVIAKPRIKAVLAVDLEVLLVHGYLVIRERREAIDVLGS